MITCKVIEDLLPLYADEICSDDSRTIVEHHVAECNECREKLDTMKIKLVSDSDAKAEIEHSKVFKLFHKRYARLGIITLLICAAILIPSAILCVLTINEETDLGCTFSSIMTEHKLKQFGKMIKNGEYSEFLDSVTLQNQSGYTDEEIAELKAMYAEDFKNYFEKYPVKRYTVECEEGQTSYGYLLLELETDLAKNEKKAFRVIHFDCSQYAQNFRLGVSMAGYYKEDIDDSELAYELCKGFPATTLIGKNKIKNFFDGLKEEGYYHKAFYFYNYEKLKAEHNMNVDLSFEITRENEKRLENLFTDYTYVNCETGEITYMRNEIIKNCDRYFSQSTIFTIKDKNGTEFTVSFDLPILNGYIYYSFQNITYSENTPKDFKTRFEEIFA